MGKHVFFVRHGESDSNKDGIHRGAAALLTPEGERQARAVAKRIARIGVDALVASPYPRTLATARPIAARTGLSIEESDLFVERRRPSLVVGNSIEDANVVKAMDEIFEGYTVPGYRHSDEENFDDLKQRALAALDFLARHGAARLCVVTHGLFLRVLFCAALNGSAFTGTDLQNAIRTLQTSNTGVSHFRLVRDAFSDGGDGGDRWLIAQWNDSAHLG